VYHVELRQFPHNLCRFNLAEEELRAIAEQWARGEWVDLGERKWNRHQAKLTILEGPRLPVGQLSMGRGWRNAQRQSEDVTARVLAAGSDSPGPELLSLLGDDSSALLAAWRVVAARCPERSPSECLALAEQAIEPSGGSPG
jgi:hypothetical protein